MAFFERALTHPKGGAGKPKPFTLEPWQREYVRELMGWKQVGTNLRRYRQTYLEIPRKNGKTTLAAGLLLYMLLVDRAAIDSYDPQAGDILRVAKGDEAAEELVDPGHCDWALP